MSYKIIPVGNQFVRNFPVPLDRDFVFDTTQAREGYLTNPNTSGIAYSGLIAADNETKKAYLLTNTDDSLAWVEIGADTTNDLFVGTGIMVKSGENAFRVAELVEGNNISIQNKEATTANPIIGLSKSLTNLDSINVTGLTNGISSSGGIFVSGDSTFYNNVGITGNLNVSGSISVGGASFSQSSVALINFSASSGNFTQGLTLNDISVSLSGHSHTWGDMNIVEGDGFCDDVASCVNTPLSFTNGIDSSFANNTLTLSLTGQASGLHNMSNNGFFVKKGSEIVARSIEPSGTNIIVGSGNGQDGNPTIALSSDINVSNIYVGENVDITGNLYVRGESFVANVSVIEVEDPTIRVGKGSGVNFGDHDNPDNLDRGIEFVYPTGASNVATTGFFGFDKSDGVFTVIPVHTGLSPSVYDGLLGTIKIGRLWSTGLIGGNSVSERATLQFCNIDGGSPGVT